MELAKGFGISIPNNMIVNLDKANYIRDRKEMIAYLGGRYYILNGERQMSNIALALEHNDSRVYLSTSSKFSFTIYFGRNIDIIGMEQLIEMCHALGWSFIFVRTRKHTIRVDFYPIP